VGMKSEKLMKYLVTIGLEVHVQLLTRSKMFCACKTDYGSAPNTQVCPVCLGYPGALPVINAEAVRLTVLTGLMLGSKINTFSKFDRKNYFYPDMPKNYQISQYDCPFCTGGEVEIVCAERTKKVKLTRIHLEEDVGKNMHLGDMSSVDFNRAGHPLMEIVSEPDMNSPEEAFAFLLALKQILTYGHISGCNLEEGNVRCDINCSLRPESQAQLGVKAEIKNLNTFKGVFQALKYEIERQTEVLNSGGVIVQETRRWDSERGLTESMRSKEEAHDYRYFPDPDLLPVVLNDEQVERWKKDIPELPRQRRERIMSQYGIPEYDAKVLSADKATADFFEEAAGLSANPKAVSNWVMTEMLRLLSEKEMEITAAKITPSALAELVKLADDGTVNSNSARQVFTVMFEKGGRPEQIIRELGLVQVSNLPELEKMVKQAIADNQKSVADYRGGKEAALKYLVGQVMRLSRGKANPQMVQELLKKELNK
jgi:aspartyl-tRNA(Asn)/glutamyl-tRNA(Gln) amidotransferase subunit B